MKTYIAVVVFSLLAAISASAHAGPQATGVAVRTSQNQPAPAPASNPSPAVAGRAKIDPVKEADIRQLMDVTGSKGLMKQIMDGMEKSLKPMMVSSLPPGDYRDRLVELFFEKFHSKADTQELIDMAVAGYDKYLSDEEIKGLIAFYQTPLGRKALEIMPKLTVELQSEGVKWGQELGRQCMLEVLAEHPDLAQALAAAGKTARPQ